MNKVDWTNLEEKKKYHQDFNKAWYEKNKEKRKIQLKEYAQAHKADSVKRVQKYVAKNKDKVYAYGREYNQTVMGGYRVYKGHATQKKRDFLLTAEQFASIIEKPCLYCGEDAKKIGIDRIDNTLGYTVENSAPCCTTCNYMKKNYTTDFFISHITKIYVHNEKNQTSF